MSVVSGPRKRLLIMEDCEILYLEKGYYFFIFYFFAHDLSFGRQCDAAEWMSGIANSVNP